jgi:hypothetical protein
MPKIPYKITRKKIPDKYGTCDDPCLHQIQIKGNHLHSEAKLLS